EGEQRGERESQRRVGGHHPGPSKPLRTGHAQHSERGGTQHGRRRPTVSREEEHQHDAGQYGVADRVGQQRLTAQHEETPEQRTRRGQQPGDHHDHDVVGGHAERSLRWALRTRASTPRCGANTTDTRAIPVANRTITGPAGSSAWPESTPPSAPQTAPTRPDNGTSVDSRLVTCRAATTGATSSATMRMAPTVRTP